VVERPRMREALVLAGLAAVVACGRTEEPLGALPRTAVSVPKASRAQPPAESAPDAATGRCMVPLPKQPPPAATAAARCPLDPEAKPPTLPLGSVTFTNAPESPVVRVELASSDATRSRGLMYRTQLPQNQGMLFSWPTEGIRRFWMHNTCIPLDMLFIAADGFITGIVEQVPTLNDASRSVPCPAAHVLELNAGWARRHGVKPGQRVELPGRSDEENARP